MIPGYVYEPTMPSYRNDVAGYWATAFKDFEAATKHWALLMAEFGMEADEAVEYGVRWARPRLLARRLQEAIHREEQHRSDQGADPHRGHSQPGHDHALARQHRQGQVSPASRRQPDIVRRLYRRSAFLLLHMQRERRCDNAAAKDR